MKASQAISGEIQLESLLKTMIRIILENAGAQRGLLLLEKQGEWFIEAETHVDQQEIQVLRSRSIGVAPFPLPVSMVQYVVRTTESVILNDASQDEHFGNDPYFQQIRPKSILCAPILHQNQIKGILYLENHLTSNTFTPERLEMLRLLSAQTAISIENAQLYQNLEQRIEERTQELSQALGHLQKSQQQLVESEKMAALGGLVAGVAHEINTPLGVGVTAASNLKTEVKDFTALFETGKVRKVDLSDFLDMSQESSDILMTNLTRAAELVQSFKKVAVDFSNEKQQSFLVKSQIEEVLKSLQPQLKKTHHRIRVACDPTIRITSYPGEFAQIVTNLVMNSLFHAYDAEESGIIEFTIKQKTSQLEMLYQDNGKGIPQEHLNQIFEPFFTTKRGKGGTGLGMHIIYNIVTQKLQGNIRCESEVGKGVRFWIEIPSVVA